MVTNHFLFVDEKVKHGVVPFENVDIEKVACREVPVAMATLVLM